MTYLKRKLLNYLLKHLFNAITEDDVLRIRGGKVYVGKNMIPQSDVQNLISEAEMIQRMDLWKYLISDAKSAANDRMYKKSVSYDDMFFGKAALWIIDLLEMKVKNIIRDFTK